MQTRFFKYIILLSMFFSSLELVGFKSFKREKFLFNMPISVFTGPNGCGKTNILDAIRWVMGEQNFYTLRVKSMADLIFHGSDGQKPMSMADASILLNNNNNTLPIEFEEVRITRRVFPQGESLYMINGRPCRLKDITLLLQGTGLSQDGYFLITHEKIDTILKSNEERIRLFEEASEISPYRLRKEEALGNLRKTLENITRIEDIVGELKNQGDNLKYQASKAKRYKRLKDELNVYRYHSLKEQYNRKNEELEKLKIEEKGIEDEIVKNEKINKEKKRDFESSLKELKEKDNKLFEIGKNREKIKDEIARKEERLINLTEAISKMKEKKEKLLGIEGEKRDILQKQKEVFEEDKLLNIRSIIKEMLDEEEKVKDELIDGLSRKAGMTGRLNEAKREITNCRLRIERLNEENKKGIKETSIIDLRIEGIEKEKQAIKETIEKQKKIIYKLTKREDEILKEESKIKEGNELMKIGDGLVSKRLYGVLVSQDETIRLISHIKNLNLKALVLKINEITSNLIILNNMEDVLSLSNEGWKTFAIDIERIGEAKTKDSLKEIEKEKIAIIKERNSHQNLILKNENQAEVLSRKVLREKENKDTISLKIERADDEIMFYKTREDELCKEIEAFGIEEKKEEEKVRVVENMLSLIKVKIKNLKEEEKRMEDEKRRIITNEELKITRLRFLEEKEREREAIIKEIIEKENEEIILKESLLENKKILKVILNGEKETTSLKSAISLSIAEGEKTLSQKEEAINSLHRLRERNNEKIKEIEISLSILNEKISSIEADYGTWIKDSKTRVSEEASLKIEKELLKYSNIDISAISEYDKIKERITFYEIELSDLNKAKNDLLCVIDELDKKANELFNETFKKAKSNFSSIFLKVLGGGSADITLNNGRIDIEAQMPGKKKKGLFLLSSGERALLAILILFSLFIVKPAPFCFLDEVDASLDEANVKRFIDLIKLFSKDVQFLVISHNKKTLEIGDTIYGITMETPGVSKSLSLRLKK